MKLIVDIKVLDLKRAIRFYTEALTLTLRHEADTWAALTVGDAEIHLYTDGGVTDGVEFYVDDLDVAVERLGAHGVTVVPGTTKPSFVRADPNGVSEFPWGRMAFFKDSEGNGLALVKDNPQAVAEVANV